MTTSLTEEAVDDSKEAAHGADHRGHDLVSPLDLLVTFQPQLGPIQQRAGRSHGGRREVGGQSGPRGEDEEVGALGEG